MTSSPLSLIKENMKVTLFLLDHHRQRWTSEPWAWLDQIPDHDWLLQERLLVQVCRSVLALMRLRLV